MKKIRLQIDNHEVVVFPPREYLDYAGRPRKNPAELKIVHRWYRRDNVRLLLTPAAAEKLAMAILEASGSQAKVAKWGCANNRYGWLPIPRKPSPKYMPRDFPPPDSKPRW